VPGRTLAEVLPQLRRTYCGTIAFEIEHISSHEQRVWLREHIESGAFRAPLSGKERLILAVCAGRAGDGRSCSTQASRGRTNRPVQW